MLHFPNSIVIKKIIKILRPLHLGYDQSKYIFKEIRKGLEVKQKKKSPVIVESLPLRSVETLINTAYRFQTKSRRQWGLIIKTIYLTGARVNEFLSIELAHKLKSKLQKTTKMYFFNV